MIRNQFHERFVMFFFSFDLCVTLLLQQNFKKKKKLFIVVSAATVRQKKNTQLYCLRHLISVTRWMPRFYRVAIFFSMCVQLVKKRKNQQLVWFNCENGFIGRLKEQKSRERNKKKVNQRNNKRIAGDGKSQSQQQSITSFPEIKSTCCVCISHLHFHKFYVFRLLSRCF